MLRHIQQARARPPLRKATQRTVHPAARQHRALLTLAIETSCDDTSVAILDKNTRTNSTQIHYHAKVTADNLAYRGVHPLVAQHSHEHNLADLISRAVQHLPRLDPATRPPSIPLANTGSPAARVQKPDFVSVTRGPGMRASLNAGLNTAKGLAVAWQVPLVAVNHMQAHALTPRLVSSCAIASCSSSSASTPTPSFPFLSLLVSGGHSLLLRSDALCSHPVLASTADIAVGDAVDKMARDVLPAAVLDACQDTMYGPALEAFAFRGGAAAAAGTAQYAYVAPRSRGEEMRVRESRWGWAVAPVLAESRRMAFSFTGVCSAVKRIVEGGRGTVGEVSDEERRELAREAMRVAFEHLASRVLMALQNAAAEGAAEAGREIDTLVVSGGVAANGFLRHVLRANLDARGYADLKLVFPPLNLCTDNAAMIGWAGLEMFEAGWTSDLSCQSLRKWSLDPAAEDGGILGVTGWQKDMIS